jgi:hypothetical protein
MSDREISPLNNDNVIDQWTERDGIRKSDPKGEHALVISRTDYSVTISRLSYDRQADTWLSESSIDLYPEALANLQRFVAGATFE